MSDSQKPTLRLVTGGKETVGNVSSVFGPLRAGLIVGQDHTIRTARGAVVPTGLLSYSEKRQAWLRYKSFTGTAISSIDILYEGEILPEHLAERGASTYDTGGTDDCA